MKLTEIIKRRINLIKSTDEEESLKKHLCPFFERGDYPKCITCKQSIDDLIECRDYYLERIILVPMDIWQESFDTFIAIKRDKISLDEVVGVGINCNSCYMYDKCPLFKENYACAIDWGVNKPKTAKEAYDFLIEIQYERVRRAAVFEKIDGGVADAGLSGEMDRLSYLISGKADLDRDKLSISMEATSSSRGGGLLASIFGGGNKVTTELPAEPKSIEEGTVEYVETIEVKEPVKVDLEKEEIKVEKKVGRTRKRNTK